MELHNLKPAKGSIKSKKRAIGRGEGSKKEVLQLEGIKVQNLVRATLRKLDLKVGSSHYKGGFLNLDLLHQIN